MTGLKRVLGVLSQPLSQLKFGGLCAIKTLCVWEAKQGLYTDLFVA